MISFLEFKNNIKNNDFKELKSLLNKDGFVAVKLLTDDHKTQIKQFDKIKKEINYKPDNNYKIFWNNSNNFTIVNIDKIKIMEI